MRRVSKARAEAEIFRKGKEWIELKLKCVSLKNFRRMKQRCLKPK